MPSGTDNDKKWRLPDTAGNFKLRLIDPQPIRRILRFVPTESNNAIAKIRFTCHEAVNIYWGDGTNASDVIADDDLLISHTFTTGKLYYEIIITGEVNNISNFSHNCIVIWTRL